MIIIIIIIIIITIIIYYLLFIIIITIIIIMFIIIVVLWLLLYIYIYFTIYQLKTAILEAYNLWRNHFWRPAKRAVSTRRELTASSSGSCRRWHTVRLHTAGTSKRKKQQIFSSQNWGFHHQPWKHPLFLRRFILMEYSWEDHRIK